MRLISTGIETIAAAVILIPILLIEKKVLFGKTKQILYYIIFALYLASVYAVVGLPSITYLRFDLNLNMIPFVGMIGDFKNSILNVILFIPLGFALALLWEKYTSIKRIVLFSFGMSLSIEILQIFTFRATDVNDLITNTLGAILGCLIAKLVIKKQTLVTPDKSDRDLYILNGTVLAVMFFIQPSISSILWSIIL